MDSTTFLQNSDAYHNQPEVKERGIAKLTQYQRKRVHASLAAAFANISAPTSVEIGAQVQYKDFFESSPLDYSTVIESKEPLNQIAEDLAQQWGVRADQVSRNSYQSLIAMVGNDMSPNGILLRKKSAFACTLSPRFRDEDSLGKRSILTLDTIDQEDLKLHTEEDQETDASVDGERSTESRSWRQTLQYSVAKAFKTNLRAAEPHSQEDFKLALAYH